MKNYYIRQNQFKSKLWILCRMNDRREEYIHKQKHTWTNGFDFLFHGVIMFSFLYTIMFHQKKTH